MREFPRGSRRCRPHTFCLTSLEPACRLCRKRSPSPMNFRRLLATGLAIMTTGISIPWSAEACDQCRGAVACRHCAGGDDHGILDSLSSAAHLQQPRLPKFSLPRLPSLNTVLRNTLGQRPGNCASCGCELSEATGGCETREPSCGSELHEPSCGCEVHAPGCGCEVRAPGGYQRHIEGSYQGIEVYEAAPSGSQAASPPAPPSTPEIMDTLQRQPKQAQPLLPVPAAPGRPAPLPDNQVDPFRDDAAMRIRRLPARPAQHRSSSQPLRPTRDVQAAVEGGLRRVGDTGPSAGSGWELDEVSSSRLRATRTQPELNQALEVVTVSAIAPERIVSPGTQLPPRNLATPAGEHLQYSNPLRAPHFP